MADAMNSKFGLILVLLALASATTACGRKGDLYMPEQGRTAETSPTTVADDPESDSNADEPEPANQFKELTL